MNFRKLCGALTLLLLVAPLGASICGDCAPDQCLLMGASGMSDRVSQPSELPAEAPRQAKSHCDESEVPPEEPPPCHGATPTVAASDCCSMATVPQSETAAALTGSVAFEIALGPALDTAMLATEHDRSAQQRRHLPLQPFRPLYTLHSAFLI